MPLKRIITILAVLSSFSALAQGLTCAESDPFCTGTIYNFPAGTTGVAESGPYYGCLSTRPAPAWYHMKIGNPGSIAIYMYSTPLVDIDFICWGPFADPFAPCPNGLTQSKMVDCSYSPAPTETVDIPNGQTGEYYVLLITNYSQQPCNITFSQTGGTGSTDCSILPPLVNSDSPICVGETLHLTAETIANASYSWTGPAGFSSNLQNPVIPDVTLAMAGDYSCIITVYSQSSPPAVTTVVINDLPDAGLVNASATTCPGDTAMMLVQLTGAAPFEVIYSDGYFFYTVPDLFGPVDTIFVSPPGPATYTLTQVSDTNCTKILSGLVFHVYNYPAATGIMTGGRTICPGDTAELVFNLTGTPPWTITYLTNGMNPVTLVAGYTPFYVPVTPLVTSTYSFTELSDAYCEGNASGQVQVAVDNPSGGMTGDNTICAGDDTQLVFNLAGYPPWTITYTANGTDPQTVIAPYSPYFVIVSPTENTLYEFTTLEDAYCSGVAGGQAMITIHEPTGELSGEATICNGESAAITFTLTGDPPWTIKYLQNGGNLQTETTYSSPYSVPVEPDVTSVYSFSYMEDASCEGTTSGTANVLVNPLPVANAGTDKTIPNGTSTTLNGSVSGGSGSYAIQWEPAAKLVNAQVLQPVTVNLFASTLFTLTVTDEDGGCTGEDEMLVTITGGVLTSTASAVPAVVCRGETSQLQAIASGGSGNYSYLWSSNPPGFSSDVPNPVVEPQVPTSYTVTINDGFNSTQASASVDVNVLPVPDAGQDQVIIYGTPTTLNGSASQGSGNYSYHWEPAYLLDNPDVPDPNTEKLYTTTVFTLNVTDQETDCACGQPDVMSVMISGDALSANPSALPPEICRGDSTRLFASAGGGTGNYTYSWSSDPPGFHSVLAEPAVQPDFSTQYNLQISDGFNFATGSVYVTVFQNPVVNLGNDTVVCVFDTVILDAGDEGESYLWFNGASSRQISIASTGIGYETRLVTVTVTSEEGCVTTKGKMISFDFTACSGIEDRAGNAWYRLYPNPGNGRINLEETSFPGEFSISVFDAYGKNIYRNDRIIFDQPVSRFTIDISSSPNGIYLFIIQKNGSDPITVKYLLSR